MTLFYPVIRFFFRNAFWFFYHKVTVIGEENIPDRVPVILAVNHPNSFMDAMIIAATLKPRVNSLTRGDAFKKKFANKILRASGMIPVFRLSEGKENLGKNFETFKECQTIFENNGIVLIFIEGLSENNWKIRPFKKGVFRIAMQAWQNESTKDADVIPVGVTYQHYHGAGKSMIINFGAPVSRNHFDGMLDQPNLSSQFNAQLKSSLESLSFFDDDLKHGSVRHQKFISNWNNLEKKYSGIELFSKIKDGFNENEVKVTSKIIPSAIHATVILIPHYWLCSFITNKFTRATVFYDSVLFGLLVFLLPLYVLLLLGLYFLISHYV